MSQAVTDKEIGREMRFGLHLPAKKGKEDLHLVKETITYEDSQGNRYQKPNLKYIKNFKRNVWIAKPTQRGYKQKREYTHEDELQKFTCTQSELRYKIASGLGMGWSNQPINKLCQSPYVYGSDISSTSLLKHHYMQENPGLNTPFTVGYLDIEADVFNNLDHRGMAQDPLSCTVVFKDKIYLSVYKEFLAGIADPAQRIRESSDHYLKEYIDKHKFTLEVNIADNPAQCIANCFAKLHEWQPDFLAIWNMNYDIPTMLKCLERHGYKPKDVLCDPRIPEELRVCNYVPGPTKKVTASNKHIPIKPAAQWHTFYLTASFYIIDAMCSFKHLRLGEQEESSYGLDAILEKILGIRKLKFKEAEHLEGMGKLWHEFMQRFYRIEYMVYNIFDCVSMLELDLKTKDLSHRLAAFSGTSDFKNFKSQPKRIIDALHFFALNKGFVLGTVGASDEQRVNGDLDTSGEFIPGELDYDGIEDEDEEIENEKFKTLSCNDWIITLPAHNMELGLKIIVEDKTMQTLLRAFVYDSDSVSSYPTCLVIANVSKRTTKRELISMDVIDEETFRMQNLNLVLGKVNAIEYSVNMFGMPKPTALLEAYKKKKALQTA